MPASVYRTWTSSTQPKTRGNPPITLRVFLLLFVLAAPTPSTLAAQPAPRPAPTQPRAQPAQPQRPRAPQPRLRIRLNTPNPVAGQEVVIVGSGLPAGSQVTARLTAPNGSVSQESTRVQDGGRFRLTLTLPKEGDYTLVVRGQGMEHTRVLEVLPNRPPPNTAPDASAAPSPTPNPAQRSVRPATVKDRVPTQRPQVPADAPNNPPNAPTNPESEK